MSKTKLTLIVTVRGDDPHLARTMRTARETAGVDIHRILVVDGGRAPEGIEAEHVHCLKTSRGVQAARHAGIQHAKTSLLVFTDAHMGFSDGWGREVCAFYRYPQRAKTVACSQMRFIGADGAQPDSTLYRGCRMSWKTIDSVNGRTDRKEHNILVAKWGGGGQPGGKIGAIMGAFYAFRRAWYEDLACPWECGTSWGRDEEVISMASWLGGGDVRLLPESVTVSHIDVGAGRWTPTDADTIGMMCNRGSRRPCR